MTFPDGYQCPVCKSKEYQSLPVTSIPNPTLNYEINKVQHSIKAEFGVVCLNCGHVDFFVDIVNFTKFRSN